MISKDRLDQAMSKYELTSEHKRLMGIVHGNIPFAMPVMQEYELDYDVPDEYPGTDEWQAVIKDELDVMRNN